MSQIHVGDIGLVIRVTIEDDGSVVDVSSATTKDFYLKRPDGSLLGPLATTFTTDGTDGQIEYATVSGDLSLAGLYDVQVIIVIVAQTNKSEVGHFTVRENIIP